MKKAFVYIIRLYQRYLSPDQGVFSFFVRQPTCVFYPTCSEYCISAVEKYGILRGFWLFLKRIVRCHPGAEFKIDPVPEDVAK
jgi:hypothetical protein